MFGRRSDALPVAPLSNMLYAHGVEGGRIWLAHLVRGSLAVATGLGLARGRWTAPFVPSWRTLAKALVCLRDCTV